MTCSIFLQEGIGVLKSTIDAKKEVYGEYSQQVATTWKLIGNVHLADGESEKALRALKKVWMIPILLIVKPGRWDSVLCIVFIKPAWS